MEAALKKVKQENRELRDKYSDLKDALVKMDMTAEDKAELLKVLEGRHNRPRTAIEKGNRGENYVIQVLKLIPTVDYEDCHRQSYQGDIKARQKYSKRWIMIEVKDYGAGLPLTEADADKFRRDLTHSTQDCVAGILINLNGPVDKESVAFDFQVLGDKVFVHLSHFRDGRLEAQKATLDVLLAALPHLAGFVEAKDVKREIRDVWERIEEKCKDQNGLLKKMAKDNLVEAKNIKRLIHENHNFVQRLTGKKRPSSTFDVDEEDDDKTPSKKYPLLPGQQLIPEAWRTPNKNEVKRRLTLGDHNDDDCSSSQEVTILDQIHQ